MGDEVSMYHPPQLRHPGLSLQRALGAVHGVAARTSREKAVLQVSGLPFLLFLMSWDAEA